MHQQNMFDSPHHFLSMTGETLAIDHLGMLGNDDNQSNKSIIDFMETPFSGGYNEDPNQRPKKKSFCRPTQDQIREMEAFFNECPYPNDMQKNELASRLSLATSQVKFWFQKKRYEKQNMFDISQKTPETKSGILGGGTDIMGAASGGYDQVPYQQPKKKQRRHSQLQIQEMEAFFFENPIPDASQMKELSSRISLAPLQVKFWFQNKRTQVKAKLERMENLKLRAENEQLRADNMRCKEALANATCPCCGFSADMSLGGLPLQKILFGQEHLMRGTPETTTSEETGTIVDLDFGWSKGGEVGNNAPRKLSETGNDSEPQPMTSSHRQPAT